MTKCLIWQQPRQRIKPLLKDHLYGLVSFWICDVEHNNFVYLGKLFPLQLFCFDVIYMQNG